MPKTKWSHGKQSDHMWRCLGFWHPTSLLARNLLNFFTTASTCDNTTPPQVLWFSDFIWILYNLNSLFPQLTRHVTSTRCSRFHVTPWIRPQHTLNIMNINFWMTKFHYSMDKISLPWGALGKNVFAECRAQEALGKICFQKIKKHFAKCPRIALGNVF